jgi:hypothetical protein
MSSNKPVKIARRRRTQKQSPPVPIIAIGRRALRFLDRNIIILIILVLLLLCFEVTIRLNYTLNYINSPLEYQLKNFNSDAELYYGLAKNLVNGTGFYDTIRNEETMPSIGHPAFLAMFCIIGGLTPAQFSWFFFMLSFVLLAVAVRIYSKSNLLAVLSLLLLGSFFKYIWWYAANVETTIVFTNVLLAVTLAAFYRNNFSKLWAIISGLVLYIHIIVRPLLLFPTHLCLAVFLVLFLYLHIRKHLSGFIKGWFVLLITAECLLGLTYGYSYIRYHDARLINGTYGAYPLYAGNNIYIPPNSIFDYRVQYPKEFWKMYNLLKDNPGMTWQQRHEILMKKVIDYWKQYPSRAITGWWWRFRQFLGIWSGNFSWKIPLTVVHAFLTSVLLTLIIVRIASAFLPKKNITAKTPRGWLGNIANMISDMRDSLGLLFAALFLVYSAVHALFSYVGFRYASPVIPLLIVADAYLLYEVIKNIWTTDFSSLLPTKQLKRQETVYQPKHR